MEFFAYGGAVGVEDVKCYHYVSDVVVSDVAPKVAVEVTEVDYVYFTEAIEEIAGEGVSKAVLYNKEFAAVLYPGLYAHYFPVSTHECTISTAGAVFVSIEELSIARSMLLYYMEILVEIKVNDSCDVGGIFRSIIYEIFRRILDAYIFRVSIHGANEIAYHLFIIR